MALRAVTLAALAAVAAPLRLAPSTAALRPARTAGRASINCAADFVVSLLEPITGRVLPCYLASSMERDGATFAALSPADAPVSLAELADERLVPVEDETEAMVAAAQAACEELRITLLDTPVVLTATGEGLDELDFGELDDEDDEDEGGEEAFVLTDFEHKGQTIFVVQTLDPLYVVGKRVSDNSYVIPSDDEIEEVSDEVEDMVSSLADELEEAEEVDERD